MKDTINKIQLIFAPSDLELTGVGFYGAFPPLGLISLVTYLKQKFPDIIFEVLDGTILSKQKIIDMIDADIVGFSALAFNYKTSLELAQISKQKNAKTLFGNHHAIYLYNQLLKNRNLLKDRDCIDFLIANTRSEISFEQLIIALLNKKELSQVPWLAFRKDNGEYNQTGDIDFNKLTKLIPKLSDLPIPDRNCIKDYTPYFKNYSKIFARFHKIKDIKNININSIKGCARGARKPCVYCCLKDNQIEEVSAKRYWNEIILLYNNFGFNVFFDLCNSLTSHKPMLKNIAKNAPQDFDYEMMVYGSSNEINSETVEYLKMINANRVIFGYDAGYEQTLQTLGKVGETPKSIERATYLLNQNDIQIYACYVPGAPGETKNSLKITYEHILKIMDYPKTMLIEYSSLLPLPGSAAFNLIKNKYYEEEGIQDILNINRLSELWLSEQTGVTEDEILSFQNEIIKKCKSKNILFGGYH